MRLRSLLFVLLGLLGSAGTAHAVPTYRCTNTSADSAGLQAVASSPSAQGAFLHLTGGICKATATLVLAPGTIMYGDGPANIRAPDVAGQARQVAQGYVPTAQTIVASTGPSTQIVADVTAMAANPFSLISVTGQPVVIRDLSLNGSYSSIGTINQTGTSSRGIVCTTPGTTYNSDGSVAAVGGLTLDDVDVENVGSSFYYLAGGGDCGVINSVGRTAWGSAAYGGSKSNGTFIINDVFTDTSKQATYGSTGGYFDMIGMDPQHANVVISQTSLLGGDVLLNSAITSTSYGGPDYTYQNYTDNSSTIPTCGTLGLIGLPVVGQKFTMNVKFSQPAGATPSTYTYPSYTTTQQDVDSLDPLFSVMQQIIAPMNGTPLTFGGTSLQTFAWPNLHSSGPVHVIEIKLPGPLACTAVMTLADTGTPGLNQTVGKVGANNGSGGGGTRNGTEGPFWDVDNYIYSSRAYCDVSGGANVGAHLIGNFCDGYSSAGFKVGSGIADGSPDGGENSAYVIGNRARSPNPACGSVDCVNSIYITVSAKCGTWTMKGSPILGEVLTVNQASPTASNSPQKFVYTVTPGDMGTSNRLLSVATHFAYGYSNNLLGSGRPLSINGAQMAALEQSSSAKTTAPLIQFSLKVPQQCTETIASYTDILPSGTTGSITVTNVPGGLGDTIGAIAFGNSGGPQLYPAISNLFWGLNNETGNYP